MTKRCIYFVNHFAVSAIKTCMFFLFVLCSYRGMAVGQTNYGRFFNVNLETEAAAVCCVLHDEQGMAWLGTDKGVYSYDGYNTRACFGYGTSVTAAFIVGWWLPAGTFIGEPIAGCSFITPAPIVMSRYRSLSPKTSVP